MARKVGAGLVALSSAAIVSVYAAGYVHTQAAAEQLAAAATPRAVAAVSVAPSPPSNGMGATDVAAGSTASLTTAAETGAASTIAPSTAASTSSAGQYRDGVYTGTGMNRHGDLEVSVTIKNGRIASANIARCGMQYPCSRISMLPGQVVSRQSTDVDIVTGATMSTEAYQEATQQALAQAGPSAT